MEKNARLLRTALVCRRILQGLFIVFGIVGAWVLVSTMLAPVATASWLAASIGYPSWPMSVGAALGFVASLIAILGAWMTAIGMLACTFDPDQWWAMPSDSPARSAVSATKWLALALTLSILGQVPLSLLATLGADPGERMIAIGLTPAHAMGILAAIVAAFLAVVLSLMADLVEDQREIV